MSDQNTILPNILTDETKIFILSAAVMPSVYKIVKTTLKILQQMLQIFNVCLTILWT